jgi:hypothetical protein
MFDRPAKLVPREALPYFKSYPGPVLNTEYAIFRESNPDFTFSATTLRGYRTILVKHKILDPTAENLREFRRKRNKPRGMSPLGSLLATIKSKKEGRDRCFARSI